MQTTGRAAVVLVALVACALQSAGARQLLAPAPAPGAAGFASVSAAVNATSYLSVLSQAISAAGLTSTLSNTSLVATVFAPSNTAFAAFLSNLNLTPAQLLANPATLATVLQYHVVPNVAAMSMMLTNNEMLPTLLGQNVTVLVSGATAPAAAPASRTGLVTSSSVAAPTPGEAGVAGAKITGISIKGAGSMANVIVPNIVAGKSIVHIIDYVLVPAVVAAPAPAQGPAVAAAVAKTPAAGPASSG